MSGFYHLKTPQDLLQKAMWDYEQFLNHRSGKISDYCLFNLITSLNHLRDWIRPHGLNKIDNPLAYKFYEEIYYDEDFKAINQICNTGKHFNQKEDSMNVFVFDGFSVGNRVDEPLDVRNHYVGDSKVIERAERLLERYCEFIAKNKI